MRTGLTVIIIIIPRIYHNIIRGFLGALSGSPQKYSIRKFYGKEKEGNIEI